MTTSDTITYVSYSFSCPLDTRQLGEAFPVVKIADDAMQQFRKCIELIRTSEHAKLRKCAEEIDAMISEVLHDTSWAYWVEEARDAYAEARVTPVRKTP